MTDALFGTHIREAYQMLLNKPHEEHSHCWHQWGDSGSGGILSDGSSYSRGSHRCCWCGRVESYEHKSGPTPPIQHGQYYAEILQGNV